MGNDEGRPRRMMVPPKLRRALRVVGWNALLLMAGLALIWVGGEAWVRSTVPFTSVHWPTVFVPGVGVLLRPDTEIRWTNGLDFWTVSRTNSLGFLDREPPSPERAAESCHVTMIGDSFVEARQVAIPEKFHVRLEEMAAREFPHLDMTTSAFGMGGIGQIAQLPFYDEYARRLRPRLIVLVFVPNDYFNNFPLWISLRVGPDPEHLRYVSAVRAEDGSFRLRPPDPEYQRFKLPRRSDPQVATLSRERRGRGALNACVAHSGFLGWLCFKRALLFERNVHAHANRVVWAELLRRRPAYAPLLEERFGIDVPNLPSFFAWVADGRGREGNDSPFYEEALAFTAFGLDEFKDRAARDGAALVILATHRTHRFGGVPFAHVTEMAAERGIPVIDQGDVIHSQGAELRDARWAHDDHWNPTGHRWAAEALLEYLKQNQDVCGETAVKEERANGRTP